MFRRACTKACTRAWTNQHVSNSSLLTKTKLNSALRSTSRAQLHIDSRSRLLSNGAGRSMLPNTPQTCRRYLQTNAFESLGIFPPLASNLKSIMDIETPTVLQDNFIPPILAGKDVLIRDTTGSGKTFGILLALLSKPRKTTGPDNLPGITSVVIVPNQELAFQIQSWVQSLFPAASPEQIQGLIQAIVTPSISALNSSDINDLKQRKRSKTKSFNSTTTEKSDAADKQIQQLSERLPHILVATPARLWDLVQRGVLDLSGIDTLVLDEVDHLIRLPKRFASQREIGNRDRHPKPGELVVREIMRSAEEARENASRQKDSKIQIVAASATMNRPMRYWLQSNDWINDAEWVDTTKSVVLPEGIEHHCLVIGTDSIRNMKLESDRTPWNERGILKNTTSTTSAIESANTSKAKDERDWDEEDRKWKMDKESLWKEKQLEEYEEPDIEKQAKKFRDDDDRILEGVATACLLDNVENACIFFCSSFSLSDLATRLEADFGVVVKPIQNAFEVPKEEAQLSSNGRKSKGGIYIANESNARGLDLPGLSHVYIVGLPSAPSSYIHMAGRTGRMGKNGQVVTILRDDGHIEDRARSMFRTLDVDVKPFRHVE
ncbi:hypothetical protein BGZ76_011339 [Entomortierella beljakovae]|nr:hypothetical protein BGZ76_011339 [Entomortierella beljakovae]